MFGRLGRMLPVQPLPHPAAALLPCSRPCAPQPAHLCGMRAAGPPAPPQCRGATAGLPPWACQWAWGCQSLLGSGRTRTAWRHGAACSGAKHTHMNGRSGQWQDQHKQGKKGQHSLRHERASGWAASVARAACSARQPAGGPTCRTAPGTRCGPTRRSAHIRPSLRSSRGDTARRSYACKQAFFFKNVKNQAQVRASPARLMP